MQSMVVHGADGVAIRVEGDRPSVTVAFTLRGIDRPRERDTRYGAEGRALIPGERGVSV